MLAENNNEETKEENPTKTNQSAHNKNETNQVIVIFLI